MKNLMMIVSAATRRSGSAAVALAAFAMSLAAQAAPATIVFELSFDTGDLAGQSFAGSITVDEFTGSGSESFDPNGPAGSQLLGFDITIGGVNFTASDDPSTGSPIFSFTDGRLVSAGYGGTVGSDTLNLVFNAGVFESVVAVIGSNLSEGRIEQNTVLAVPNDNVFAFEKVVDSDETEVPGGSGVLFNFVDQPPLLSNGRIFSQLRFGGSPPLGGTEGLYIDAVGEPVVEIIRDGDPMPDGDSTVARISTNGYDISGDNRVFTVERASTGNEVIFFQNAGATEVIVEENVTALPGGSGDLFTSLSVSDPFTLDGTGLVFEGFGSGGQNGIYSWFDGALAKVAAVGDASPDGSTFSGSFDEPSLDGQNIAFEARTNSGTVQGVFGVFDGAGFAAVTTNTTVPGQVDTFTFLDNPQIDGAYVVFNAEAASVDNGFYRVQISPTVGAPEKIVEVGDDVPGQTGKTFSAVREQGVSMDSKFVAFVALFDSGSGSGVYAWVDGTLLRIVDTTQQLGGKTPSAFELEGESVDGNQVAFDVEFTDGSIGIYIATLPDSDGDDVVDVTDNCPANANPGQEDLDGDDAGDLCDDDVDGDGLLNEDDTDDDNDGLSDDDEATAGSDPFDPDSDDDDIVDGLDRSPLSDTNNLCLGLGSDVVFTTNVTATFTCAATSSITVAAGAAVSTGGDLLFIAPTVSVEGTSAFSVDSAGAMSIVNADPTATSP